MDRYLFYKMTHDSGFVPNPFGKHLTLAACTPNHILHCSLDIGDYIIVKSCDIQGMTYFIVK